MSNLVTRILVALVGIPLILLLTMAGGFYFFALVAVLSAVGLHEFYHLARAKGAQPQAGLGVIAGCCVNAAFMFGALQHAFLPWLDRYHLSVPLPGMTQLLMILMLLFLPFVLAVELFRNKGSALGNVSTTAMGVLYVSLFFGSLIGLRELFVPGDFPFHRYFDVHGVAIADDTVATVYRWGGLTVVSMFASIWVCDSAAYFAGRKFGKHKLMERVSPKKTWEGAIAGLVGAIATFVCAKYLLLPYLSLEDALICGGIVGIFGQIGDLVESLVKRDAGVKDTSALIPGHGGVLDRFDSLLFVSPLIYLYIDFVVCRM